MNPFDRLLALAPLGVLAYVLHRHDSERRELLRALESDRESFRNERRELINRVVFPTAMPTATRPVDRRPDPRFDSATVPATPERQRRMLEEARQQLAAARVGTFEPPDLDELVGTDSDKAPA